MMIIGFIIGNVTEINNEIGYEIKGRHNKINKSPVHDI